MKKDQIFPSKYLKEPDLRGREVNVTISSVERVSFQGKPGLVIYFEGKDKGLACNQTIFDQISFATGEDDTENWTGHRITLYPTETTFQGEMRPVIRVKTKAPSENGQQQKAKGPPKRPKDPDAEAEDVYDEEIPF
jgi:hypothetical protein